MIWSCDCQIVAEEKMDGRHVPVRVDHIEAVEFGVLVFYAVLLESFLHVERTAQTFPDVASSVFVKLKVPVEYFPNGLFGRDLEDRAVIVDHVDDSNPPGLLGEFANNILRILPPLDLAIWLNMQVFSTWTVVLSFSCLSVDLDSRFAAVGVEPVGDVGACRINERSGEGVGNMLLDEPGEVVDLSKEDDPAVVGCVVVAHLFQRVVTLLLALNW